MAYNKESWQRYYKKHREDILIRKKTWRMEHPEKTKQIYLKSRIRRKFKIKKYKKLYNILHPYAVNLWNLRKRCNDPSNDKYRWYGAKGIKTYLTLKNMKFLWERDMADQMTEPSIDRINAIGGNKAWPCSLAS